MRKDDSGKMAYVKHTRNTRFGKRGVNKGVRRAGRKICRREKKILLAE